MREIIYMEIRMSMGGLTSYAGRLTQKPSDVAPSPIAGLANDKESAVKAGSSWRQISSLRRQKRINNGTRHLPHAVLAVVDELAEHRLHAAEVGEFGLDLVEALAGDGAHRVALGAVRQLQQLGDLVQTESQFLGALDE